MTTMTVELGERSYPISVEANLLSQASLLSPYIEKKRVVVVSNQTVADLYADKLGTILGQVKYDLILMPDGEQYKNLQTFEQVIGELLTLGAGRDTILIALGGGVVGDLTGYVAASFQRGIPFIQIPTTLLAQVDSSVGGKTAVNHPLGKNMIGAFYQPKAVVIDTTTLSTLPDREFAAGMAEVIKYGIIYDLAFFEWLEQNKQKLMDKDPDALAYAISRSCEIKAEIVALDERESGIRALLNLGHTFGHAIEAEQGYGNWLHGEAVAAGMILAAKASEAKEWLEASETRRIVDLLSVFELPLDKPEGMGFTAFMKHMRHDKKVAAGQIRFILPQGLGKAVVTSDLSESLLTELLN
ncbi:3-dehydroquinate synthase [Alteromonadaceae bacterium M269]|nr:3-dehydroquinate synthase [Alteromonadaceae bacterium M269]